jgi:hypothetical protein
MKKHYLLTLLTIVALAAGVRATTVIPPTFDELVDQAEVIFQGKVTDVTSQWAGEGAQRHIVSYVTFKIEEGLKGNLNRTYTIRMLGGTVGDESMGVTDAPTFVTGDRDIVFVQNNGTQFIPLVGIMHGRFHVERDQTGRQSVLNKNGEKVSELADFKAAIHSKLAGGAHPVQ